MTLTALEIHLDPDALAAQMARDVAAGLAWAPRTLPPKYFYDGHGSDLFDQITRLPEYYPTRTEKSILAAHVKEIAEITGAITLMELGSGTSEKTRLLLDTLNQVGTLRRFVPLDVDPVVLGEAATSLASELPGVEITPVQGDFEHHLDQLPRGPQRLLAFLGSTIGNLDPRQRASFLVGVRESLEAGDHLLLGTDLVKDPARLVAAYDDAQGVTAAFNKNVLRVLGRELGADFDLDAFEHVAVWDPELERIEMRLRSLKAQTVRITRIGLEVALAQGEEIRTEISTKFRRAALTQELARAGLEVTHWWTDPDQDFALSLSRPV